MMTSCIGAGNVSAIQKQSGNSDKSSQMAFPKMSGLDLHGETIAVPSDLEGQFQIVSIAFLRKQQTEVNTWIDAYDNAVQSGLLSKDDVRYYELPVIYEMNAVGRFWANNGMRSGIQDEAARTRTITIYTDRDQFFDIMDMSENSIYTILLDSKGHVLWRQAGALPQDTNELPQDLLDIIRSSGKVTD